MTIKAQSDSRLTGTALLSSIKDSAAFSKKDTAIAAGYFTEKDGKTRVDLSGFYAATLEAKGISLDPIIEDARGKSASYCATVHANGQISIGSTYTKQMGLKEGDCFEIKLGYKHIRLVQKEAIAA
jgi:AbrB-like transcriptional regulator